MMKKTSPIHHLLIKIGVRGVVFSAFVIGVFLPGKSSSEITSTIYNLNNIQSCSCITQVFFTSDLDIVVCCKKSSLFYKKKSVSEYSQYQEQLNSPHAIIYADSTSQFLIADTDNNRIFATSSLEDKGLEKEWREIAGQVLERPHDVVVDQNSGYVYTINPGNSQIFRISLLNGEEDYLDLSSVLGYSRALSLIKGKLFVVGSSHGKIVRVDDFVNSRYSVYTSFGKKHNVPAGNWQTDGLIPNDVEYYKGFYYVSSFFTPSVSSPGTDYNTNKFIRFRNWDAFENGDWQDLSDLLPDGLVPYYLTAQGDYLYIAMINHHQVNGEGRVVQLQFSQEDIISVLTILLQSE